VLKELKTIAEAPSPLFTSVGPRSRPVLTVTGGPDRGRVIAPLPGQHLTLGRSEKCSVSFDDQSLSRTHASLRRAGDTCFLRDLGSTNGTFVNDARLEAEVALKNGDQVRLGKGTRLRFSEVEEAEQELLEQVYQATKRDGLLAALRELDSRDGGLQEDLAQARDFQQKALSEPPLMPELGIELVYRPLDQVGGDLYHLLSPRPGLLRVFLADATGHGIKAALTTMLILSEFEAVKHAAEGPAEVLRALNERITSTHGRLNLYFTAVCLDLDLQKGELRHASAAHPAPLLLRGTEAVELESGGPLMGLAAEATFPEWSAPLLPNDRLLAFTDGATEVFSPGGEAFGEARLIEVFREATAAGKAVGPALGDALAAFVGPGRPLDDDISLIALHWAKRAG
jgi:serine phosphatase RsbU (regulator of sigma subunit)